MLKPNNILGTPRLWAVALGTLLGYFTLGPKAAAQDAAAPVAAAAASSADRAIGFSWGTNDEVQAYELEFSREGEGGYSVIPGGVKSTKKAAFEGKLPPGDYHIRIRSLDQRGVPGPWGVPIDLVVPFSAVQLLSPAANKKIKGTTDTVSSVTFKWRPIPSAPGYHLKVTDNQQKVILEKTVSEPALSADLLVAKDYTWEVRVEDDDDVVGDEGAIRVFTLLGARLARPEPQLEATRGQRVVTWAKPEFAETFAVKLMKRQGKKGPWEQVGQTRESSVLSFSVPADTPPGSYRVDVVAAADRRIASKTGSVRVPIDRAKTAAAKAAKESLVRDYRLNAAYTPVYWRHGAAANDNSGVSFNILMFQAFAFNAEAWFLADKWSVEMMYGRWSTVLFGQQLPGSGTEVEQKPLKIDGQDYALKGKYNLRLLPYADLSITYGIKRNTAFFFYKDTPSTIAVLVSDATYFTVGSGLVLQLWQSGELRGWAETDYPLNGEGFKIEKATDYRLNANLTSFVHGRTLALLFLYQYDYRHWDYNLTGLGTSGHVTDSSHTFGAGLEVQF